MIYYSLYSADGNLENIAKFHKWAKSTKGIKFEYQSMHKDRITLRYSFKNANIQYEGHVRVEEITALSIQIEGTSKQTVEEICDSIETNFPELKRKGGKVSEIALSVLNF